MYKYRCDLCDKYSTSDPNLLRHHIRHAHVFNGPFRCGVCSKDIFGGRRVFQRHLQLHAKDHRDFQCDYCSKEFVSGDRLSAHIQSVHMERSFACKTCPKIFATKFGLARHTRAIHGCHQAAASTEKAAYKLYSCERCTYSTPYMSNLTSHVRRVHKVLGYTAGRTARKVIALSGASHRCIMAEKAKVETQIYLASLSSRRGKKVTIEGDAPFLSCYGLLLFKYLFQI